MARSKTKRAKASKTWRATRLTWQSNDNLNQALADIKAGLPKTAGVKGNAN